MKYKELLNFEPITEVVKFSRTSDAEYQKSLIKTFSFCTLATFILLVSALLNTQPVNLPNTLL